MGGVDICELYRVLLCQLTKDEGHMNHMSTYRQFSVALNVRSNNFWRGFGVRTVTSTFVSLFICIASALNAPSLLAGTPVTCTDRGSLLVATASANAVLNPGECMISKNKEFVAVMQGDGNFVVYPYTGYGDIRAARFRTNTSGRPGAHLEAQQDGQVVVYAPDHKDLWHACDTGGTVFGVFHFEFFNDGHLEMNSVVDRRKKLRWASNRAGPPLC